MNKYFNTLTNTRGDSLPGYRAQVVDSVGSIVTIYADDSGTRFTDSAGNNVNYATADNNGIVEFYWTAADGQALQTLDASGTLVRSIADFANNFVLDNLSGTIAQSSVTGLTSDLAAKAVSATLAGTGGAALIGTSDSSTVQAKVTNIYIPPAANSPTSLRIGDVGLSAMKAGGVGHNVIVGIGNAPSMTGNGVPLGNPDLGYGMTIMGTNIGKGGQMTNPKDSILFGYETAYYAGDMSNVIAIGAKAFYCNGVTRRGVEFSDGIAIGLTIGFEGITLNSFGFTVVGNNACYNMTQIVQSSIEGAQAGQYLARLYYSNSKGYQSLGGVVNSVSTYTEHCNAIGYRALGSLKDGTENNALGSDALISLTDGGNNDAFGRSSLASVVTSGQNVAFGGYSGTAYVGSQMAAVGFEAFKAEVGTAGAASGLAGVGWRFAFQATGNFVSGIGWNAFPNLTTGTYNVGVGVQAGTTQATGTRNVYVGDFSAGTAAGSDQVALGYNAVCTANLQFMFGEAAKSYQYVFNGYSQGKVYTVAGLPAATTAGRRAFVSDSTVAASGNFGATVAGGGANNVPVFSDGTNWLIG